MVAGRKVGAFIQTRMTSSRQPGKAMLDLCGKPLMERVVDRVRAARVVDEIWMCTSVDPSDDVVELKAVELGVKVHRGELEDTAARFMGAATGTDVEVIVRVTGDNPLTETRFIDLGAERLAREGLDYLDFENIPYGAHVWVFTRQALARMVAESSQTFHREHIVPFFYDTPGRFNILRWENPIEALRRPDARITLDTLDDYVRLYRLFHHFRGIGHVMLEDAIAFLDTLQTPS